jgi:hypothetical protein
MLFFHLRLGFPISTFLQIYGYMCVILDNELCLVSGYNDVFKCFDATLISVR